jgi:hypothetical protein
VTTEHLQETLQHWSRHLITSDSCYYPGLSRKSARSSVKIRALFLLCGATVAQNGGGRTHSLVQLAAESWSMCSLITVAGFEFDQNSLIPFSRNRAAEDGEKNSLSGMRF